MIKFDGYLDKYGMVTCNGVPAPVGENSENGLLFTAHGMYAQLGAYNKTEFDFEKLFTPCFIDGKLYRSPEPHPKPDSHDNYSAVAMASSLIGNTSMPRKLLWSLVKHFGVVNGEIFLRFPQVWILLLITSFPMLKWLFYPLARLLAEFNIPKPENDGGDIQLKLTIIATLDTMYKGQNFLEEFNFKLSKGLNQYYNDYYRNENFPTVRIWNGE